MTVRRGILSAINKNISSSWQAETIDFFGRLGIADDNTIYYLSTAQEITGHGFYVAIDKVVVSLIDAGILAKRFGVFPIVGGTSARHQENLIKNSPYSIEFMTAWTHSATGMLPDGVSSFARILLNGITGQSCTDLFNANNMSVGMYSRTNNAGGTEAEFGQSSNNGFPEQYLFSLGLLGDMDSRVWDFNNRISVATIDTTGYHLQTRVSDVDHRMFQRGAQVGATIVTPNTFITPYGADFNIGCYNNGGAQIFFSTKENAGTMMGEGLTPSEAGDETTIINQMQIDLHRNV